MRAPLIVLLFLITACGGAAVRGLRLDDPPRPAVTADVDRNELFFDGAHGVKLYAQYWRPKTGEVKAVLVIHHGLADHSARYSGFAERLVHAGYAVWALDMRGHGRSGGRRITFDRIDDLTGDLDTFVALVRTKEPGKKVFLFGHSLGGLTTALYAIERQPEVGGVILSAPGIAFDIPAFGVGAIRFVAAIAPNAPLLRTPHDTFSSSADVIADMRRDPLIESPEGPARSSRAAVDGVARVWARPERLVAPLLAVHGTGDRVVAPTASRELVARAGTTDRTLRLYDELQHDLLHEPNGGAGQVATDIVAWLDAHNGGPAVSFTSAPHQRLPGDRKPMSLAIDLDVRGERADSNNGATGGIRIRLGIGRPIGYSGGLDLRAGYFDGGIFEADVHPLGLAIRSSGGASFAVTAGIGIGGARGISATHVPIEAGIELPLGPLHVLGRAGVGWLLSGDDYTDDAFGIADEATGIFGVRLGRDRRYWPGTAGGAGPFVAFTYHNLGGSDVLGVALGGQLWGGN